jgi:hypothetical protein
VSKFRHFLTLIKRKFIALIFLTLLAIIAISLIPSLLHFTFDFTIVKAFVLQLSILFSGIYAYPIIKLSFKKDSNEFHYFLQLIIIVFFIQSIIEILAFTLPGIADIIHLFQKDSVASKDMGGLRALALAGNPFFDLAAAFGLIYILFFRYLIDVDKSSPSFFNIIILGGLFFGTFFAGRTGFVGLLMALLYYLFSFTPPLKKILGLLKLLSFFILTSLLIFLVLPSDVKQMIETKLLPFAFEFWYNYMETGDVTTKSTENLSEMYFPIPIETFFWGDGRYSNADGSYYKYTDAGYMRQILYYGLLGPLILVLYQLQFIWQPIKLSAKKLLFKFDISAFNNLFFFIIVLIYLLILNYKGEVIGFLSNIQVILLWVQISYYYTYYSNQEM